jgi:C4-dicarboxylate-specific signal transduction histidine kinase
VGTDHFFYAPRSLDRYVHASRAVAYVLDLTERRRAQEEHERLRELESDLAHMNRLSMMGELAASLAHEIKQPIAAARNNARAALNFLDKRPPDLAEVREALGCRWRCRPRRKYHRSGSRPDQENAPAKGPLAKDTSLIEGDRVQLQQVLLNLILNAVEAVEMVQEGPRELSISAVKTQANLFLVSVRDTGPGISAENMERVFEAFYTTKSNGIGMGLSICRSIIDAHGGRLRAEANEPRGAIFQFTLPAVP